MKSTLIQRFRHELEHGRIEGVVWWVPSPVEPSRHDYKYRLVYVVGNVRVVGFDNERGKGDHKHVGDTESAYEFVSVEQLVADFIAEVERWNAR